ncbi:hypothetical protein FNJ88_03135 [Chryseobacterium sp. SNU WT5]|uniref:tetratricopeptide repeat protein n=1 Tax=Chryseobacterium sp. SNU WT5 TaxID=2594269 RepID=UPI00117C2F63|nr:hypothetical protein [Chryseobacterium sp. SNU WT5]QDP84588.1 hypothetical protein FNJ88_03135 [Chryseobacterium sp. SNU WT5]
MKKVKVINTQKAVIAALFFGAVTYGYGQNTLGTKDTIKVEETAPVEASQQNPTIEVLKKQVEANANDTEALVKLATAYQDTQDWNNTLATWTKITTLLPDWAPAYYSKAYVYQTMKDEENAKKEYEKYIVTVKPAELEANKKNLAYAHFFVAYQLQKTDKEQAKQNIAKSLQYDAANEDAIKLNALLNQ